MKKMILSLLAAACMLPVVAQQQFIIMQHVNNKFGVTDGTYSPTPVSDVVKITFEADKYFETFLLPGAIAEDNNLKLFNQALQLTGLADSLKAVCYPDYTPTFDSKKYYYRSHTWSEVAWFNQIRLKMFSVFAETDAVYAAAGITTIDQLKAYAKQVYDEYYPEDAAVSDPTDRRNSLNRFVAYHILPQGTGYYNLTCYDGYKMELCVDRTLTDIASWYPTMMPHAALKCSYPAAGTETGMYLNRRGLKGGPDKYGVQVRGAKILPQENGAFDYEARNGYYYYIDGILAYDKQTREQVLGGERWRVDFKHLSPDFMHNAQELLGNYLNDDDNNHADDSDTPRNGRNIAYQWDALQNITGSGTVPLIHRRAHANFWSWQGDEVNLFGDDFDFTIKLPQLPAGEWEVRLGYCGGIGSRADVRIWLNDQQVVDSLIMAYSYYADGLPFSKQGCTTGIIDYMLQHYFSLSERDSVYPYSYHLVTDLTTGEQMWSNTGFILDSSDIYPSSIYRVLGTSTIFGFSGQAYKYGMKGQYVNWSQLAERYRDAATTEFVPTLPKVLLGPKDCFHFSPSALQQYRFSDTNANSGYLLRAVLGRIKSDGKTDNYLRIKGLSDGRTNNINETMLDYFEFVPAAIVDNTEIPEE